MKKKKPVKKKAPVKKAKASKKSKPTKKKKVVKKTKVAKKKKVIKKTKAAKKKKGVKKAKAAKKAKPKKKTVSKKVAAKKKKVVKKTKAAKKKKVVKKAKAAKKAAPKKIKAAKKPAIKKAAAPKKAPAPPKEKVSLPATPAVQDLQNQQAVFTLCSCQYAGPESIQQTAIELNVDPACIIKTVVMEDEVGKPMLVLISGDQDISTEELAAIVGAQSISACGPELSEVHTGYEYGAESPFGINKVMPVFMEKSVAMMPEIYIGAGQRGLLAKMSSAELIDRLKPFMVSVAK